ncbi:MAG TPA: hypothetical protein PLX73_02510 [Candidatus Paceibacterota bacterium]|nr:hypothetical protein [Candidatus Paceibacterota bacterium]HOL54263.1 hypothetical protein [Candidatus Paceibacterota bacterium]HON21670.1 hypothetical protein [Candidatus Paceibacterota bacterium]HPP17226.1 hypothetical protein [Candidatus Paceibacterota bacterium]
MGEFNERKKYLHISLAIIGLALLVSFLIINHPNAADSKKNVNKVTENSHNNIAEAFNLEQTNKKLNANVENIEILEEDNLTLKLSAALSNQILELNSENDLSSGRLQVPNEELFSDKILQQYQIDFWNNLKLTQIDELKFGEENNPITSLQYFANVMQVINDNHLTDDIYLENLQSFIDNKDPVYLKDFISKLDRGIAQLKNIAIPPSYANLHLDLINFMNMKRTILVDLYNYTNDPIRALVASEFITEVDDYYQNWIYALTNKMEKDGALDYFQF